MNRIVLAAAALAMAAVGPAAAEGDPRAASVVARSRDTQATYALYNWNRITIQGEAPLDEWSAEFHRGRLHRVETPRDRVIADCAKGTGVHLSLVTGKTRQGPEVARMACGIDDTFERTSATWQGEVRTAFGPADRVRLVDETTIRTYDISPDGVILEATWLENRAGNAPVIHSKAVAVLRELPSRDIFDEGSLRRSAVPERYTQSPP